MTPGHIAVAKGARRHRGGQPAAQVRTYVYAIQEASSDGTYGNVGIDGAMVHSLAVGRVAAIVSDAPSEKIRPERRHLAAHQEVLKRLMVAGTTPLPMSFGIIANSPETIRKVLSHNQAALLQQLQRVAEKVEMGLRVTWDVPNIFEYFVNTHPELRLARDRFLGGSREPSQEDKIEVGRMFDFLLNEDREGFADKVEEILLPRCSEIVRGALRNEREVMNLACLVDRKALTAFETGVFEAAKQFDNNFAFDFNGPWAPYNFVEVSLEL